MHWSHGLLLKMLVMVPVKPGRPVKPATLVVSGIYIYILYIYKITLMTWPTTAIYRVSSASMELAPEANVFRRAELIKLC